MVRPVGILDTIAVRKHWFGRSLRPGKPSNSPRRVAFICSFVVLDPTDSGATIVVAPGQMLGDFLHPLHSITAFAPYGSKANLHRGLRAEG